MMKLGLVNRDLQTESEHIDNVFAKLNTNGRNKVGKTPAVKTI